MAAALPKGTLDRAADAMPIRRASHQIAAAITDNLNSLHFNVAISNLYKLANALSQGLAIEKKSESLNAALREAAEFLTLLMAPMMPHLAEEAWAALGHTTPVVDTSWPKSVAELTAVDEVTIAIQVNGKRRDEITVAKGLDQKVLEGQVLILENVKRAMEGKPARKIIIVPDRIVNIVC